MRFMLAVAAVLALSAGSTLAAPNCTKGKVCGNSCIAKTDTCHKPAAAPKCTNGVPCGNSCIAKGKTCTKPS